MRIEIRNDSVLLDGYVNVTGKDSKLIPSIKGKFKEQIVPQAFTRSLEKNANVDVKRAEAALARALARLKTAMVSTQK